MIKVYTVNRDLKIEEIFLDPAVLSLDDVTQRLPDGIYSTFRTYFGMKKVMGFSAHLKRIFDPGRSLGFSPSVSQIDLRKAVRDILRNDWEGEVRIRLSISLSNQPGQIFVAVEPLILPADYVYLNGVKLVTSTIERANPRIKSTDFVQKSSKERTLLKEIGAYEILMVHKDRIYEGVTSNFFAVSKSKIVTARQGILLGVTRSTLLKLLNQENMEIEYRSLRMVELAEIDEAFISSSSRGVVPVVKIDNMTIGSGKPGPVSIKLRQQYDDYVLEKAETIYTD